MNVKRPTHPDGQYGLTGTAIAQLIQAGAMAVGAGTGIASLKTQSKIAKKQMKAQERIARLQLNAAERSGNRDRIVAARASLLQLQSTPAYQALAESRKRDTFLIVGALVAMVAVTFLVARKR